MSLEFAGNKFKMALSMMSSRILSTLRKSSILPKIHPCERWKMTSEDLIENIRRQRLNYSPWRGYINGQRSIIVHLSSSSSSPLVNSNRRNKEELKGRRYIQGKANIVDSSLNRKAEEEEEEGKKKGSQKGEEDDSEENARKKKHMKWTFWGFGIVGSIWTVALVSIYGAPQQDEAGNVIEDEYTRYSVIPQYILRFYKEVLSFKKAIEEPSRDTLLPDPLQSPYRQPPYTLCLELTDVLVKPEWSYTTGWRFKKRPGVNFFLQQLGMQSLFEIVIYTKESGFTAYPIIDNLDPQGFIMYRLFKDATRYQDGQHIKDLASLNRPINRVIHVDCDEKAVQLNRSNAICLKKWTGDMDDRSLVDLAIFLRTIAESGVDDVRGVLEYYSQFEDPLQVFRENQRKLQEQQETMDALKSKAVPTWSAFKRH